MHCAAGSASLDAIRLLQEHNGSMNQAGDEGETPFHEAIQKGDLGKLIFSSSLTSIQNQSIDGDI